MSDLSANINIQNTSSLFTSFSSDISGISTSITSNLSDNFADPSMMSGISLIAIIVCLFLILPALVISLKLGTGSMDGKTAATFYLSLLMFGLGLWYMIYSIQSYVLLDSKYKS